MIPIQLLPGLTFLGTTGIVLVLIRLFGGLRRQFDIRLIDSPSPRQESSPGTFAQLTRSALPTIGSPLEPKTEQQRKDLKTKLLHAGFYGRHAISIFLGIKMLLLAALFVTGLLTVALGWLPLLKGLLLAFAGSTIGMIVPGLWLNRCKSRRQLALRRALPDALDVMSLCLEGGMSMQAAFKLLVSELRLVHPQLVFELDIVDREIQLGRTTGEALKESADRCDLEEMRILASVVLQSERLGASLVRAFRINADSLRHQRIQRAEELAHKAGTKVLFPTMLFIFPAIFLVVLGPAVIHIVGMFTRMQ